METYETFEVEGLTVDIYWDNEFPIDPREDWEHCGTYMICAHREYNLGDIQVKADDYRSPADAAKAAMREVGGVFAMPLYLYDHSGLSMSTSEFSCPWDSGQVGVIVATAELVQEFGTTATPERMEKVRARLRAEVSEYNSYLTGECFGYIVKDADGEVLDSCGGFLGDPKYVVEDARAAAKWCAEDKRREVEVARLRAEEERKERRRELLRRGLATMTPAGIA